MTTNFTVGDETFELECCGSLEMFTIRKKYFFCDLFLLYIANILGFPIKSIKVTGGNGDDSQTINNGDNRILLNSLFSYDIGIITSDDLISEDINNYFTSDDCVELGID